ncbi:hypothetical protein FQN57_003263 [Myotisia sp. PD_48]|nr:hypothetical protein FQN57_003263 [Myotisia sp. PD_48]
MVKSVSRILKLPPALKYFAGKGGGEEAVAGKGELIHAVRCSEFAKKFGAKAIREAVFGVSYALTIQATLRKDFHKLRAKVYNVVLSICNGGTGGSVKLFPCATTPLVLNPSIKHINLPRAYVYVLDERYGF